MNPLLLLHLLNKGGKRVWRERWGEKQQQNLKTKEAGTVGREHRSDKKVFKKVSTADSWICAEITNCRGKASTCSSRACRRPWKPKRLVFQAVERIKEKDQIRHQKKMGENVEKWSLGDQRIRRALLSKRWGGGTKLKFLELCEEAFPLGAPLKFPRR